MDQDLTKRPLVTAADVAGVLSKWVGIPVERLTRDEAGRLMMLEETLAKRVIGQTEAVGALARAVRRSRAGLSGSQRPIASLYFAGPTGVGKTELCKVLASEYYSDAKAMIRLDMSEYSEQHSVSRLIGPPPGYVGFDDPRSGQLTEAVRRRPYSVVVLDEIEKSHPEVLNLLLQVLEDGRLTDGKGRVVTFSNCIIIMTSNVGSREILEYGRSQDYVTMRAAVQAQLQQRFRPEFLNRIDELLVFRSLGNDELSRITKLALADAANRATNAHLEALEQAPGGAETKVDFKIDWTPALEEFVLAQGWESNYGARPLRRAVQRCFEDPIAELFVTQQFSGDAVTVDVEGGAVVVRCHGETFRPSRIAALEAALSGGAENSRQAAGTPPAEGQQGVKAAMAVS